MSIFGTSLKDLQLQDRQFRLPVIWNREKPIENIGELKSISIEDINKSLLRTIHYISDPSINDVDFRSNNEFNPSANNILSIIELYFVDQQISDPLKLPDNDKSLLALGLVLKSLKDGGEYKGKLIPHSEPAIAGVSFQRFGESNSVRIRLYLQQNDKFRYDLSTSEAADMFLIHTNIQGVEDQHTFYEKIQSENFNKARNYIMDTLEPDKLGMYNSEDVQEINRILLKGLVPDRNLGQFRKNSAKIQNSGRIGLTPPAYIQSSLNGLLTETGDQIRKTVNPEYPDENWLSVCVDKWRKFDAIHPMEEANGRTGTLIFESWYRLLLGTKLRFVSERSDQFQLVAAMNSALRGNSDYDYIWNKDHYNPHIYGDTGALTDYIKSHMVERPDRKLDVYEQAFIDLEKGNATEDVMKLFDRNPGLFIFRFLRADQGPIYLYTQLEKTAESGRNLPLENLNKWLGIGSDVSDRVYEKVINRLLNDTWVAEDRRTEIIRQLEDPATGTNVRTHLINVLADLINECSNTKVELRKMQDSEKTKNSENSGITLYNIVRCLNDLPLDTRRECYRMLSPKISQIGIDEMMTYLPYTLNSSKSIGDSEKIYFEKADPKRYQLCADEIYIQAQLYRDQPRYVKPDEYRYYCRDPREMKYWRILFSGIYSNFKELTPDKDKTAYLLPFRNLLQKIKQDGFELNYDELNKVMDTFESATTIDFNIWRRIEALDPE